MEHRLQFSRSSNRPHTDGILSLMGYYGNALGAGHNECEILEATRSGRSYSLRLSCTDLPDKSTRTQRAIITVLADDRIAIQWGKTDGNPTEMRWCGP